MALPLLVGLGNPGPQYAGTRHNIGFRIVETLHGRWHGKPWQQFCNCLVSEAAMPVGAALLAKPQMYMNRSGSAVRDLREQWPGTLTYTLVIHDDLDLPFGALRIRTGGGHGGHNGVRSLVEALGTGDFLRLKVGIGRPAAGSEVVEHVLTPFGPTEIEKLPALLARAAEAAEAVCLDGPSKAMNRLHS